MNSGFHGLPMVSSDSTSLKKLSEIILVGTAQASVTFSSISQSFRSLRVDIDARGDAATTDVNLLVQLNGDTGSNYDSYGTGTRSGGTFSFGSAGGTSAAVLDIPAATATANVSGGGSIRVLDYTNTTFQKQMRGLGSLKYTTTTGGIYYVDGAGFWRSTSPVTSITLLLSSGNFIAGSTFSLYGEP